MVLLTLFPRLEEMLWLPLNTLCSAAPLPVQAHRRYMPVSYFPAKGRTFPSFKCSAVLFSAVLHRITWCSILFAASRLCYVDEKGSKWPVCLKYKWKSSWQSCCCSQFLAFSCRTENSDTWKRGYAFPVSPGNGSFQQPPKCTAFICSLSQIQHMRSVCAIKGEMSDENQLIFIRLTKLSKFMSKTFGAGGSSPLCSIQHSFPYMLSLFSRLSSLLSSRVLPSRWAVKGAADGHSDDQLPCYSRVKTNLYQ